MVVPIEAIQWDPDSATGKERWRMTYPEFEAWWDQDAGRYGEWVDGVAIPFGRTSLRTAEVKTFLWTLVGCVVQRRDLGTGIGGLYQFQTRYGSLRIPDFMVILKEHRDRLTEDRLIGPADVVFEVVTADSVTRDYSEKRYDYSCAGVPEYWIIDPRRGSEAIELLLMHEEGYYAPAKPDEDGRYWSLLVPGVWIDPAWLLADELPDPVDLVLRMTDDALGL